MGKYHPLPSHPFLFSPSLVLFQEHWFLASSQTFQSCICLRDFVMTVPSDWKILPLDSHTSHVSLPLGLCSNISFSVRPTWLPHFNCNSTTRIPDMFSLVLFLTISISYFHTLLFHLSHLSVFWLFPVECKFHQGKDLFFFNSLRHPQAHSSYLQTLVNSVNVGYSFLLSFFKKCLSWYVVFSWLFSSRNFLPVFFGHAACGILIPQPGIKPEPLAMEEQSLNPGKSLFLSSWNSVSSWFCDQFFLIILFSVFHLSSSLFRVLLLIILHMWMFFQDSLMVNFIHTQVSHTPHIA